MAEVGAGAAGAGHDDIGFTAASEFEDKRAGEMYGGQFFEQGGPIDASVARWEMVVAVAFVVMDVEQSQIRCHFVHKRVELAREVGMAGVETGADAIALEAGEDPQEVG